MNRLNELSFIDLILDENFAEIKGMIGASSYLTNLPEIYLDDASELRNVCADIHSRMRKTEFSLRYDERIYRVTVICHEWAGTSFVVRQTPENILPFINVPISTSLRSSIIRPGATGLVLIAGEMGSGKTTSAASVLRQRIEVTGSLGISIEDPIEIPLHGRHGNGRCLQLEVGQNESYSTATKKALRMGASCMLLGEIRDGQTAHEVLKASFTMFVVSTIHGSSVYDAINRYVMFCEEINHNAKQNVANTLYIIAHQTMTSVRRGDVVSGRDISINAYNLVNCTQSASIKSKIMHGNYRALQDEFNSIEYTL